MALAKPFIIKGSKRLVVELSQNQEEFRENHDATVLCVNAGDKSALMRWEENGETVVKRVRWQVYSANPRPVYALTEPQLGIFNRLGRVEP